MVSTEFSYDQMQRTNTERSNTAHVVPTQPDSYEAFIPSTTTSPPPPITPPQSAITPQDRVVSSQLSSQQQQALLKLTGAGSNGIGGGNGNGSGGVITQEPKQQPPMSYSNFNGRQSSAQDPLNPLARRKDANGERDWNYGLCDCFQTFGTCCYACWCPCMVYGETKSKVQYLQVHGRPHPKGGDSCGAWTWAYCILHSFCYVGPCFQCMLRGEVRQRHRIKGNPFTDFLSSCCCGPCEQTQELREVEDEERVLLRLNDPDMVFDGRA